MKNIKAFFIDVIAQTVTEVETMNIPPSYQEMLGFDELSAIYVKGKWYCYVDADGLMKEPIGFFRLKDSLRTFAGNGLLVEIDYQANEITSTFGLKKIKNTVTFYEVAAVKIDLS